MATLKHALLARQVAVTSTRELHTISDIIRGNIALVESLPRTMSAQLVFWVTTAPGEMFTWRCGVDGPDGLAVRFPLVDVVAGSSGEVEALAPMEFSLTRVGGITLWLALGEDRVWTRSLSVELIPKSPRIQ